MRRTDSAAAEMVGAILMIVIISSLIGVVGVYWISSVPTASFPYTSLEISCGDNTFIDYPCREGLMGCNNILYEDCIALCPAPSTSEYNNCIKNCLRSTGCIDISDYNLCNMVFICHKGGDPLQIDELHIIVNDNPPISPPVPHSPDVTTTNPNYLQNGEVIRIPLIATDIPLQSVTITYHDYSSGTDLLLAKKIFYN